MFINNLYFYCMKSLCQMTLIKEKIYSHPKPVCTFRYEPHYSTSFYKWDCFPFIRN